MKTANFRPSARYAWVTTKHKWFVFHAGLCLKVPIWQLLVHDLTKYLPQEMPHYGRQFFGTKDDPEGFARAWLHHQSHNPHHWEYWIPRTTHFKAADAGILPNEPMEMPERYAREMCADWLGASRGYEGSYPTSLDDWVWFQKNFDGIRVGSNTRALLLDLLRNHFGAVRSEPHQ